MLRTRTCYPATRSPCHNQPFLPHHRSSDRPVDSRNQAWVFSTATLFVTVFTTLESRVATLHQRTAGIYYLPPLS
jgi:hypothetical protein